MLVLAIMLFGYTAFRRETCWDSSGTRTWIVVRLIRFDSMVTVPFTIRTRSRILAPAPCTCAGIVIGIESVRSVIRDHEVCELPGILVGFDLDLLFLLVHGQSACRQHGAGTLAIGGKQQLNSPNTMFPGPRSVV